MKAFSKVADARRLRWCFAASLILVTIGFALLGRLWIPHATRIAAIPGRRVFRLVFYHSPPKPVVVRQPAPKPIRQPKRREIVKVRPRPRPHPTARPIIVKRRAMLRAPSPRHNPIKAVHPANPGGSASAVPVLAAAPVQTQVTTPTPPAQVPVLMQLHSKITIARAPPATLDAPSLPDLPTQASGGSGTASGAGADSGSGNGRGSGAGVGTGDGGGPFGIGSGGAGNGEGLRHVVYVLDISGSMVSRIDRARYELRQSMDHLGPGESFNIITFSEEVHEFADFLNPATPFSIARADYFLSTLQVGGGTALEFALRDALGLHGVNVVYVITDGVPTIDVDGGDVQSDDYMKQVPAHVREMNVNHARIYTIGLVGLDPDGRDPSFAAAGMLRQIARDSGGTSEIVRLGTPAPD